MNKKIAILISCIVVSQISLGQYSTAPGEWRMHFPYLKTIAVEAAGDKVYAATEYGLFYYDRRDNSRNKLTKLDGLSGTRIQLLAYDEESGLLLIAYTDSRIDVITKNSLVNISDLYRKQITADKTINNARFIDGKIWLACGFGIVTLNIEAMEVDDTYFIGDLGSYLSVYDVCQYKGRYYAATAEGVKWADKSAANLADYSHWQTEDEISLLGSGQVFTQIFTFNDQLWALSSTGNDTSQTTRQQLWAYKSASGWQEKNLLGTGLNYLSRSEGKLIISDLDKVDVYSASGGSISKESLAYGDIRDASYDKNGTFWMASQYGGLVSPQDGGGLNYYSPDGPYNIGAYKLAAGNNSLWVAGGGFQRNGYNSYNGAGMHYFNGQEWFSVTGWSYSGSGLFWDIMDVEPMPGSNSRAWFSSWGTGLYDFTGQELNMKYDVSNSALEVDNYAQDQTKVSGVGYDSKGALWVLNPRTDNQLKVRKTDGNWVSVNIPADKQEILYGLYINSQDQLWMISSNNLYSPGLIIYDFNGTYENTDDDSYRKIAPLTDRDGGAISKDVYCITEDDDGVMWVGTAAGPVLYFSAYKAFDSDFYGTQVKITKEDDPDYADLLLKNETIQSICVDGANRKWLGTANSGAYLVSGDGTEEIHHFTEDNSPLPSDNVYSIAIMGESGEVFFGTENGIASYRGEATSGLDEFKDVYAYPNPVRPGYTGKIYITGLIRDCNVKITDISGRLVYETTSLGGQATWDGRNLNGRRVQTGVYLVFMTNEDGSKTKITKLLFVN